MERGVHGCQPDSGGPSFTQAKELGLILQAPESPSVRAYSLRGDIISFAFGEDRRAPVLLTVSLQLPHPGVGVCLQQ